VKGYKFSTAYLRSLGHHLNHKRVDMCGRGRVWDNIFIERLRYKPMRESTLRLRFTWIPL